MKVFHITDEERSRIINMHETATKNHYLTEQDNTPNNKYRFVAKLPMVLKSKNYGNLIVYVTNGEPINVMVMKENGNVNDANTFNSKGIAIGGPMKSGAGAFAQSLGFAKDTLFDYNELVPVLNQGIADAVKEAGLSVNPPVLAGVNV